MKEINQLAVYTLKTLRIMREQLDKTADFHKECGSTNLLTLANSEWFKVNAEIEMREKSLD